MSRYAWKITRDRTQEWFDSGDFDDLDRTGVTGPSMLSGHLLVDLDQGRGAEFRMSDDDGHIYFEGRIVGDYDGFEPLVDFGMPDAGCTTIEYQNDHGLWRPL